MSLTYNGAEVKEIVYNGTALKQMDYNGVTVFKKGDDWSDKPYLSFIEENGKQFTLKTGSNTKLWNGTMYYSTDGNTWNTWTGTSGILSSNDGKLFVRGINNKNIAYKAYNNFAWTLTANRRIQCHGNIENLLDYNTVAQGEHPTMDTNCFRAMFQGCTSLTQAPELPATTLAIYCYSQMFRDCTSLTQAPELPATTLADYCYNIMFQGCTSLTQAPELPATTLANNCYKYMFRESGLTTTPELPATTLAQECYYWMFKDCTSLTTAPEQLPATTLGSNCYSYMFNGCTSLTGTIHCPASVSGNKYRLKDADISGSSATIIFDL